MSSERVKPSRVFGQRVRAERQRRGWTQAQLAHMLGLRETTVNGWEVPTRDLSPSVEVLRRLSTLFGMPMDYLWPETEEISVEQVREELRQLEEKLMSLDPGSGNNLEEQYRELTNKLLAARNLMGVHRLVAVPVYAWNDRTRRESFIQLPLRADVQEPKAVRSQNRIFVYDAASEKGRVVVVTDQEAQVVDAQEAKHARRATILGAHIATIDFGEDSSNDQ